MTPPDPLQALSDSRPRLAQAIRRAQQNRDRNLRALFGGARFAGLDELLSHLDVVHGAFKQLPALSPIAFLIERAIADWEVGADAALGGMLGVVSDSMRDVMEIELLLRHFIHVEAAMQDWLTCSDRDRKRRYAPGELRRLHAARLRTDPKDLAETADYSGHSIALHVTPIRLSIAARGIDAEGNGFNGDVCFWEMFFHAHRFLVVIDEIGRAKGGTEWVVPARETLTKLIDALNRTQEMQGLYVALQTARREGT